MNKLTWLLIIIACVYSNAYAEPPPVSFSTQVKPILEKRCVVCHACYDAPCQLKMTSYEGIQRGTSKEKVYSGARPFAIDPQRLFIDAHTTEQWRERGFSAVISDGNETGNKAREQASIMHKVLSLKERHPLPPGDILSSDFDLSLNRNNQCPTPKEFDEYATKNPLAGMPYALPGLSDSELTTLLSWIEQGAIDDSETYVLSDDLNEHIARWESLLNGDSLKEKLAARYVYEHWFLGALHFPDLGSKDFFRLVRSTTPPGEKIQVIATRRPYNDPQQEVFYYRLWRDPQTTVSKTHMPLALDNSQYQTVKALLFDTNYEVKNLPGYDVDTSSNPFRAFAQIPLDSKYRFLLHNAQYTIMGFIKGPVCRGQTALNVVNDRFWVFFLDPQANAHEEFEALLSEQSDNLRLPAQSGSNAFTLTNWVRYLDRQKDYVKAKKARVEAVVKQNGAIGLESVWNGDGKNKNAALTVFRHYDSATVERGLIGDVPKTAWLIDYAMLERIHYLLVAGYDVYGNVGHQFNTRVYMDYLRFEGESGILSLLPKNEQRQMVRHWYRDTPKGFNKLVGEKYYYLDVPVSIRYTTSSPFDELMTMLKAHLGEALDDQFSINTQSQQSILRLAELPNPAVQLLPQLSLIIVGEEEKFSQDLAESKAYTLLRNNAHSNIAVMFGEDDRHLPEEDTATLVPGFIGDYPNALWYVPSEELENFTQALASAKSEQDYKKLRDKYGVRRTHSDFWEFSDLLHTTAKQYKGLEYGVFDLNRLENR